MFRRLGIRVAVLGLLAMAGAATALGQQPPPQPLITLGVLVTDAQSGQPISQARLTLTFRQPKQGRLDHAKTLSYSAKTDAQGRYRFPYIPTGTVILMVTDEHHQTFGKQFDVDKDHALLEVKLKPPQPLL